MALSTWIALVALFAVFLCVNASTDLAWHYGEQAYTKCLKETKPNTKLRSKCSLLQEVIEESFDVMGTNLAHALEKTWTEVTKNVENEIGFRLQGDAMIDSIVRWLITEGKTKDKEEIRTEFHNQFTGWILKVVANDKSSLNMFPSGVNIEDIMRNMNMQKEL